MLFGREMDWGAWLLLGIMTLSLVMLILTLAGVVGR